MRTQQRSLLDATLRGLRGVPTALPELSLADMQLAGLATGLTALAATVLQLDRADAELTAHLREQQSQVRHRVERFRTLIPRVASALAEADVPAVFVKGAALIDGVWRHAAARPMADIDLVVPRHLRAQAGAALQRAGCRWTSSTSFEDAYLAWGDGSAGRLDGESADHNGRVEVHPGWSEFLHGYEAQGFDLIASATTDGDGTERRRLDLPVLTAQILGHLGACVVRCEVRAVNVVDVWCCDEQGLDWGEVGRWLDAADPRLTAPAAWLVSRVLPEMMPAELVRAQLRRLPGRAQAVLAAAPTDAVWRDPASRTTLAWRQAFTTHAGERWRVLDQLVWAGRPRTAGTLVRRARRRA